ncbi:hypothetical protein HaLaN_16860 [Haematococcus lacustris]|uniref:Uncharacterized protein n=1 Tax=Haematococcus lacustris TaxID=44745 RepID=A0A699ZJT5_HAELA|nr:hypothetical protein HaLaN_16860 [Haematococcus lacustris]
MAAPLASAKALLAKTMAAVELDEQGQVVTVPEPILCPEMRLVCDINNWTLPDLQQHLSWAARLSHTMTQQQWQVKL